jgi:glycosyltransferase involved in cell wall biosynthesis
MSSTLPAPAPVLASVPEPAPRVTTSIILPAYNEGQALPHVLAAVFQVVDPSYEVLVVDDGSSDNTVEVARTFPCRVLQHPANQGKGAALQTGIAGALGQYLVIMDADATYPASAIPQIVKQLADHDLVRCNRRIQRQNMPLLNNIGNWIFDRLLALIHGLEGADHLSGLYGLRREAVLKMRLESMGFDIEAEIGIKARIKGLRITSFPIDYQPRVGEKKLRPWRDGFAILSRIIALILLYNPLATFVIPGLALLVLTASATLVLRNRPVFVSYFGLDVNTFIIVTLGIIASFQLMVFGIAAALYSVEAGYRPPRWLVWLSSRPVRLCSAAGGFFLALYAALNVAGLIINWLAAHGGLFLETRVLVLNATLMVFGLQILSAALFLSIFAGRLQRLNSAPAP